MWLFLSLMILFNFYDFSNASSYGKDFLQCSVWGNSHGFNFDNEGFEINGYCNYILATTNCMNYNIHSSITPFTIELERSVDDKTILAVGINIEIYGNTYKLLRGRVVLVNGVLVSKPYRSVENDIMISFQANTIIFSSKFMQIHWDGYEHIDIYLCNEYKRNVCGLCGNADGIQGNDFSGINKTNLLSDSKFYKYKEWTDLWQNEKSKTRCVPTSFANTARCNQDKFKTNEYCGLMTSLDSPWSLCLKKLPQTLIDKLYDSCVFDMCQFQMNKIQQQKAKCDHFQRLSQACYDIGITNFEWRKKSECPVFCSDNEYYGIVKTCPKTCLDPAGIECGSLVYKEGCHCKNGYVLDSKETCVLYKDCGCKAHDGSQIIEVGDSYNAADCTKTFYCDTSNSNCAMKSMVCSNQRVCGINDEFRYSCVECPADTVYINGTCISEIEIQRLKEIATTTTTKEIVKSTIPLQLIETTSVLKHIPEIVKEQTTPILIQKLKTTTPFIKLEPKKTVPVETVQTTKQEPFETTLESYKYADDRYYASKYYTQPIKASYYTTTRKTYPKTQISTQSILYKYNPYYKPQIPLTQQNGMQIATAGVTVPSFTVQTPNMETVPQVVFTTPSAATQIATLGVTIPTFTLQTPSVNNMAQYFAQFFTTPASVTQIATLGVTIPTFTIQTPMAGNIAQLYAQMFTTPFPFTQIATLGVTIPTFNLQTPAPMFNQPNFAQFYGQMFTTPSAVTQIATLGVTFPSFMIQTPAPMINIPQLYGQMFTTPFPFTQIATLGVTFPTFTLPSQVMNGGNAMQIYGQMFTTPSAVTQIATLGVTIPTFTLQTPSSINMGQFYGQFFTTPAPFTQIATLGVTAPTFTLPMPNNGGIGQLYGQFFTTPSSFTQIATLGVTFPTFTLQPQNFGNMGQLYGQFFTAPAAVTQIATLGVTAPTFNLQTPSSINMGQFYAGMFNTPAAPIQTFTLGVTMPTFNLQTPAPMFNQPNFANFAQFYGQMFTTPSAVTQIATLGVTFPSFTIQTPSAIDMGQLFGQFFTTPSPFTQIATLGVTIPTFTIQTPSAGNMGVTAPTINLQTPINTNQGQSYANSYKSGQSYARPKQNNQASSAY